MTSNQVWGLTKTDDEWSGALEAALMATRRGDLQHGTNAAYVRMCLPGVSGAPAHPDGQEPLTSRPWSGVSTRICDDLVLVETAEAFCE
jgi:hypothetical protein